ncbi:hypothetical protein JI58_03185 [Marinosulfonomonas sp. PRT-SC04]|nr:hypothetical protein JI58_03185 [Marinosulfonomonas sp. PRT-SC04]
MISYTLKCENDHRFDSWFQSADAFDKLRAAGMVTCVRCESVRVEKAIMAPRVRTARKTAESSDQALNQAAKNPLSTPTNDAERAIGDLKAKIEATSEYVGVDFVSQARAMHDGDAPERSIYGEAKPEEALKLLQDGVPVAPLPFTPKRKIN